MTTKKETPKDFNGVKDAKDLFGYLCERVNTIQDRLHALGFLANSLPDVKDGSKMLDLIEQCRSSFTLLQDVWASGVQSPIVSVHALDFCGNVMELCAYLDDVDQAGKTQRHNKEAFKAVCSIALSLRLITYNISYAGEEQLKDFIAGATHGRQ
ncbi:hypothetical protein Ares1_0099 [Vibrio phage Ares1]|nr:hypothetical protein Ares1_0099 [Vibrio phage Ares1]